MCPSAETGDSFESLVKPHLERLYRLAWRLTGSRSDAEDLVQDVLYKAFDRQDELSSITELGPWLGRVLYNLFIDETRKHARRRLTLVDSARIDSGEISSDVTSDQHSPERSVEQEFSISQLQTALGRLSLDHRTVLMMHDIEGYQLNEIQLVTGLSLGTIKSRLHRARARLRELFEADGTFSAEEAFTGQRKRIL